MPSANQKKILDNIKLHERVSDVYNDRHPEIYNEIEQLRLSASIDAAVGLCYNAKPITVIDYGCGTGNLTRHFLRNDCHVVTADVTRSFAEAASKIDSSRCRPHVLNGSDLREFEDSSVDIVATYSVLHHIPDYLLAIREMCRVLKPGGILYLDHERCESYWVDDPIRNEFLEQYRESRDWKWYLSRLVSPKWWVKRFRKTINPRFQEEGDIHVWPDDHIEWSEIRSVIGSMGLEIAIDEAYLHYQPHYDIEHWRQVSERTADMRLLVAKKPAP